MTTEPMLEHEDLHKEIIQWGCKCLTSLGYTAPLRQEH
jgi:hypothetical protein